MQGLNRERGEIATEQAVPAEISEAITELRGRFPLETKSRASRVVVERAPLIRADEKSISWHFAVRDDSDTEYSVEVDLQPSGRSGRGQAALVADVHCECAFFRDSRACTHGFVAVDYLEDDLRSLDDRQRAALAAFIEARGSRAGDWYVARLVGAVNERDGRISESESRLQWRLGFDVSHATRPLTLKVYEQKKMRRGSKWSKGRQLDWTHHSFLQLCSRFPQDLKAGGLLRSVAPKLGHDEVQLTEVLPALVGHPHVVWDDANQTPAHVLHQKLRVSVEAVEDDYAVVLRLGQLPIYPGDEKRPLQVAVTGSGWDARRVIVADPSAQHLLFSQTLDRELADWVSELLDHQPPSLAVDAKTARSLLTVSERLSRLVPIEIPEALAGPRVPLDALALLLAPRERGLLVRLRIADDRLTEPMHPGEGPSEIPVVTTVGPQRLVRDFDEEMHGAHQLAAALALGPANGESEFDWYFDSVEESLALLDRLEAMGEDAPEVLWPEGKRLRMAGEITPAALRVRIEEKNDWFGIQGAVKLEDEEVALADLLQAIRSGERFVRVGENTFARIGDAFRQRLSRLDDAVVDSKDGARVARVAAPLVDDVLGQDLKVEAVAAWRGTLDALEAAKRLKPRVPKGLKAELREYQKEGYRWLARLSAWKAGGVLADDMGLGKTIQALGILIDRASEGPALVVAPTSVGQNWLNETERFAPELTPYLYRDHDRETLVENAGPGDLVITSYALLQRDAARFSNKTWHTLVLDEAQFIKNAATKTARAARGLDADWRLALSGTPLENHLGELWSLMRTISPGLLGTWEQFRTRFADPIERHGDAERQQALARLVQPFILRRTKSKVLAELPPRTEVNRFAELSTDERSRYEAARVAAMRELSSGPSTADDPGQQRFRVLAWLTRLRQLACHPRLVDSKWQGNSAKMDLLLETVDELRDGEHRALIFSQFVQHLSLVREALDARGIRYQYLDGSTPAAQRQHAVDAFQRGEGELFLISLKAGGTGLNLTAANYVIHMDPWWNPAVEDQATDRAHRIGQKQSVTVLRMVARDTIEEQILSMHESKRELVASVLSGTDRAGRMSTEEMITLIRGE